MDFAAVVEKAIWVAFIGPVPDCLSLNYLSYSLNYKFLKIKLSQDMIELGFALGMEAIEHFHLEILEILNRKINIGKFYQDNNSIICSETLYLLENLNKEQLVRFIAINLEKIHRNARKYFMCFISSILNLQKAELIVRGCRNIWKIFKAANDPYNTLTFDEFNEEINIIMALSRNDQTNQCFLRGCSMRISKNAIRYDSNIRSAKKILIKDIFDTDILEKLQTIIDCMILLQVYPKIQEILKCLHIDYYGDLIIIPSKKIKDCVELCPYLGGQINMKREFIKYAATNVLNFQDMDKGEFLNQGIVFRAGLEYCSIPIEDSGIPLYLKYKSIRHPYMTQVYGLYNTQNANFMVTEKFLPNSFAHSFAATAYDKKKFARALLQLCDLIKHCRLIKVYQIFISLDHLSYCDNEVKVIPRACHKLNYIYLAPEELCPYQEDYTNSEVFRLGMLIFDVIFDKQKHSEELENYLKCSSNFESHYKQIIEEKKCLPITLTQDPEDNIFVELIQELCRLESQDRLNLESLSERIRRDILDDKP